MGMTREQQGMIAELKQDSDNPDVRMLILLIEGLENENKNWKAQYERLISLIDRIKKDIYQEVTINRMKMS